MFKILKLFFLGMLLFSFFTLKKPINCLAETNNSSSNLNINSSSSENEYQIYSDTDQSSEKDNYSSKENKEESKNSVQKNNATNTDSEKKDSAQKNSTTNTDSEKKDSAQKNSTTNTDSEKKDSAQKNNNSYGVQGTYPTYPFDDLIPKPWSLEPEGLFSISKGPCYYMPESDAYHFSIDVTAYCDALNPNHLRPTLEFRKVEISSTQNCQFTDIYKGVYFNGTNTSGVTTGYSRYNLDRTQNKITIDLDNYSYLIPADVLAGIRANITGDYDIKISFSFANGECVEKTFHNLFDKSSTQEGTVIAKYLDIEGKPIIPDVTITGNIGEKYQTEEKNFDGYTLVKTPSNASGVFKDTIQTVTYYYEKNSSLQQSFNWKIDNISENQFSVTLQNNLDTSVSFNSLLIRNLFKSKTNYAAPIKSAKWEQGNLGELTVTKIPAADTSDKVPHVFIQPKNSESINIPAHSNNRIKITLKDNYKNNLPIKEYKTVFHISTGITSIDGKIQSRPNFFGVNIQSPSYYVKIPAKINFDNKNKEQNIDLELLDSTGKNPYTGTDKIRVSVLSKNNYKLKDPTTNKEVAYSINYNGNELTDSSNIAADLTKQSNTAEGIAKLLQVDDSNGKHYYDTLTYKTSIVN